MTTWKPATYPSVSPYLVCENADEIITFLQSVFEAELVRRFDRPDGSLMHAEVRIDDSIVMIGGGATDQQSPGPHIHVYVRDAQAVYDRAMQHGAQSVQTPTRKRADDDLRGGFRDAAGTTWWVATQ
ncbi:glyoxalase/bleomycin resistance protein/dioxygenase superfamily protein [Caballeronia novacaledonica]|uniref:Glyoxalase/bleomycin resistance protein/dioxygenase superfamily protein n=1 Tax=Caballeronia novacaledonica TaxID=1544861 RepID=A0A2U3I0G3_9BURK|nr:VOC family protein [Caballeronia novacaledonica]SPB13566.1 glyoxalase/bleomycin resistance protein/dioxygenase superfamily protein [Caballeronia novacaledonica]